MENIFNFDILEVNQPIEIGNVQLIAKNTWDHLFYSGQFFQHEIEHIRCITPCPSCYINYFNISFYQFDKNKLSDLVHKKIIPFEVIEEKGIAVVEKIFTGEYFYTTILGCPANYMLVKCNKCQTKHLMILGLTETQPALYAGQLHGIWHVND